LASFAALCLVSLLLFTTGRGAVRTALQLGGLVDGAWLGWVFYLEGGMRGDAPYLFLLQITGTTLLSSFRSGAKVAIWDSLVLYCLSQAVDTGLLASRHGVELGTIAPFLLVLVISSVVVANFASLNERELRRRRSDVEILQKLGVMLERTLGMSAIADSLCSLGCDELDASQALFVVLPDQLRSQVRPGPSLVWKRTRNGEAGGSMQIDGAFGATLEEAITNRRTLRQIWNGGPPDPVLTYFIPNCRRAVVVPVWLESGSNGVLVLDYTPTDDQARGWEQKVASMLGLDRLATLPGLQGLAAIRAWPVGPHKKLEARQIATAEQACAHAALALDRAAMFDRLTRDATYDTLTGLPNRRHLDSTLENLNSNHSPYAIAMVDLDHFKLLNDNYGHAVGDTVLANAASAIRSAIRPSDTPGRFGGEEFLVVMPDANEQQAVLIAESIRAAIAASTDPHVTASIGIATSTGGNIKEAIRRADQALYGAKDSGRNCVVRAGSNITDNGHSLRQS
jgi:diguanylate cyclase (GGDEF)-like protein